MRRKGILRSNADPEVLLAQTARDVTPMRIALDMAIDRIRDYDYAV